MKTIPVSHWTKKVSIILSAKDPVWRAWRAMKEDGVKVLPVASNNKIVGLITSQNIVRASDNGGQSMSVKEAMSLSPLVVNKDANLIEVVQSMIKKDQHHAVVVDEVMDIIGIFSWSEAFLFFLEYSEIELPLLKRRFK